MEAEIKQYCLLKNLKYHTIAERVKIVKIDTLTLKYMTANFTGLRQALQ